MKLRTWTLLAGSLLIVSTHRVGSIPVHADAAAPASRRAGQDFSGQPAELSCSSGCGSRTALGVADLIIAVNIALGLEQFAACPRLDTNGNGVIDVADLTTTVGVLLSCGGSGSLTATPTSSSTPTRTSFRTHTFTPTFTMTPDPFVGVGECISGLDYCPVGTRVNVYRCRRSGRPCNKGQADFLQQTNVSEPLGRFHYDLRGLGRDRAIFFEAVVDLHTSFGAIVDLGRAATGRSQTRLRRTRGGMPAVHIGPDSEAAASLIDERGFDLFSLDDVEAITESTEAETAAVPEREGLQEKGVTSPVEVRTAYLGQAEASVPVRELLGLDTSDYLAVRATTATGCAETGQNLRIGQDGFRFIEFVYTVSEEGRRNGVPLGALDQFLLIGQRRNDGSFRAFATSGGYQRQVGVVRDAVQFGPVNFSGTGTLNLELQIYVKRTDVGRGEPPLDGTDCSPGNAGRTCSTCTIPLTLCEIAQGNRSCFIDDVTILDGTELQPGERFTKTWRLFNDGTRAWGAGYQLAYAGTAVTPTPGVIQSRLGGPDAVPIPFTASGNNVDVSVELQAPTQPGTYKSNWRLRAPDGTFFGDGFFALIVVR